jgi:hypothetical protein
MSGGNFFGGAAEKFVAAVAGQVTRAPGGGAEKRIAADRRFENTNGLRHAGEETRDVNQRGMIGRQDETIFWEPLEAGIFNPDNPDHPAPPMKKSKVAMNQSLEEMLGSIGGGEDDGHERKERYDKAECTKQQKCQVVSKEVVGGTKKHAAMKPS